MPRSVSSYNDSVLMNKFEKPTHEEFGKEGDVLEHNKLHEITVETIEHGIFSEEFRCRLTETVKEVKKHRREFGFSVAKELDNEKFYYTRPVGGEYDYKTSVDTMDIETNEYFRKHNKNTGQWFHLAELHFHGYESDDSRVICPSFADLVVSDAASMKTDFYISPVNIICNRLSRGEVEALVFRAPIDKSPLEIPAIYEEMEATMDALVDGNATQSEVIAALRHYGYAVCKVHFNSNGELNEEDKEFMRSLAFLARRVEDEKNSSDT